MNTLQSILRGRLQAAMDENRSLHDKLAATEVPTSHKSAASTEEISQFVIYMKYVNKSYH